MMLPNRKGVLYLVPTPLDFGCDTAGHQPLTDVLPEGTLQAAAATTHWITENAKSTRAFLKRVNQTHPLACPIQQQQLVELPRVLHKKGDFGHHPTSVDGELQPLLEPAAAGNNIALVSEAGMPAIADPGALVVRLAHRLGIAVVPLVGPSSLLLALAASGLNGQRFAFVGYIPQQASERQRVIRQLEERAQHNETQVLIETPFRNQALLTSLLQNLKSHTRLAASVGLTLAQPAECEALRSYSGTVAEWRRNPPAFDWSLPAVFAIGT